MILSPNALLSLDTNVLIHWIRQNDIGVYLRNTYQLQSRLDRPVFSTVAEGELRGPARCWKWGAKKLDALDEILAELVRVDAGAPDVIDAYAELYEADQTGGHCTGENDLWIAATSKAAGAVLLTCDQDCLWMNPRYLTVEHVPMS
jgi:tRNA(fMet)-specific endonuclease VapC